MDQSRHSNQHQQLGVNKMGKNIRKSPLHQSTYYNHRPHPTPPPPPPQPHHHPQQPQPQPQPQVYNISKNDFRSIVQQLTGTPSRDSTPVPAAPQPRPSSTRLQKIRPPPLAPVARPPPPPPPPPLAARPPPFFANPNPNLRHNHPAAFPRPSPAAGPSWAESPVSAYMRYLESSLLSSDTSRHPRLPLPSPGLLPSSGPPLPLPFPRGLPNSASFPPLTPPSAFPSPTAFLDLLSPRSPYPLLSPGLRYPPPFTPNFALSPLPQAGILGAGPSPGPQPPPSPGLWFPQSPSGFLPILSPRWRDML